MADRGHDPRAFGAKGEGDGPLPGMPGIPGLPEVPGMPGKEKERPAPPEPAGRPKPRNESLDIAVRERVKAYPGNLTYIDLIRKNKRASAILVLCMILLAVVVGAAIGGATSMYMDTGAGATTALVGGLAVGAALGLILSGGGAVWAWNSGADAILRMSHAHEIRKEMDPELFNVVEEMAIAGGIPMPKIYVIGDSAMNAFATGKDPEHGVVAITAGLRQKLTRDELQGVMAHELAHIRHYDIRFSLLMATMVGLIAVATDSFLRITWYSGHMTRRRSSRGEGGAAVVMLVVALVLAVVAPLVAKIIQMSYSRKREYLADAGAVELSRNPKGLADALRRLAGDDDPLVDTANRGTAHMYIVNPLSKMRKNPHETAGLFSSHPALADRIAKLEALTR